MTSLIQCTSLWTVYTGVYEACERTVFAVYIDVTVPLVVVVPVRAVASPVALRADASVHAEHVVEVAHACRAESGDVIDDPALLARTHERLYKFT